MLCPVSHLYVKYRRYPNGCIRLVLTISSRSGVKVKNKKCILTIVLDPLRMW